MLWLALSISSVNAQNAAKNWIFGQGARVDFNPTTPVATALPTINTDEGSSAISDSNGNLLFYTDGLKVWDKNHNQMPNGFGLLGHTSSTHSALIVPCSCSKYFIFTTNAAEMGYAYGLRYSIVDMTLHGSLGDVTAKNTFLFQRAAEKLAGIADGSGGFWVVAHAMENNQFVSYHILAGGNCTLEHDAVTTKISAVGSTYMGGSGNYGQGQMKISPDGTMLAVAGLDYGNTSFVELFKFDRSTGAVSNYGPGDTLIRDANGDMFYGVEFSPDSKKLYVTTIVVRNRVFQYSILPNTLSAKTLVMNYGNGDTHIGGLQLAPDGKIYIARPKKDSSTGGVLRGETTLDALTTPNTGTGGFTWQVIQLANTSESRMGLPSVVAGKFSCAGPVISETCCDKLQVSPSADPLRSVDYRTFEIFNFKEPTSPICSVDIDMQPVPYVGYWKGQLAFQNGASPITNFLPHFQRLPMTGVISALSASIITPAVRFDLGINTNAAYNGKTILKVNHCDDTTCILEYEPWVVPQTWTIKAGELTGWWPIKLQPFGDGLVEVTLTYQDPRGGVQLPRGVKGARWLSVSLLNKSAEIYAIDGPSFADKSGQKFSLRSSKKTAVAALFEFNSTLKLDRGSEQYGRTINLLIKNKDRKIINPKDFRLTLYDENANPITENTPQ